MRLTEWACANRFFFFWIKPVRFLQLSEWISPGTRMRILDVGCGNHSVRYFRAAFPGSRYVGVDRGLYSNNAEDLALMDEFRTVDLEESGLSGLLDGSFDLVVLAHVIEHLRRPTTVLEQAISKLSPRGLIYVSHPHAESVGFPHRRGSLNFYDDPTHVTVIGPGEVARFLNSRGCEVLRTGRTRSARNLVAMPLKAAAYGLSHQGVGSALWDLYGFEEYTIGRRDEPMPSSRTTEAVTGNPSPPPAP